MRSLMVSAWPAHLHALAHRHVAEESVRARHVLEPLLQFLDFPLELANLIGKPPFFLVGNPPCAVVAIGINTKFGPSAFRFLSCVRAHLTLVLLLDLEDDLRRLGIPFPRHTVALC